MTTADKAPEPSADWSDLKDNPAMEAAFKAQAEIVSAIHAAISERWPVFHATLKVQKIATQQEFAFAAIANAAIALLCASARFDGPVTEALGREIAADAATMLVDAIELSGAEWAFDYLKQRVAIQ